MSLEAWLEFARGPLFRLCFSLMILGLLRIFILTLIGMKEAWDRSADKIVPWRDLTLQTARWLVPVAAVWRKRPLYSAVSFLFHLGLLLVPPFLAAHVLLWKHAVGFAWPALPQALADGLTILTVAAGLGLFAGRVFHPGARALSRRQEYLWPLLLVVPFATGYLCSNAVLSARTYQWLMLIHVLAGDLILVLIPFTKIAHCVLFPLSQYVSGLAWKFPPRAGRRVAETLGYADRPVWVERPRVATDRILTPTEEA